MAVGKLRDYQSHAIDLLRDSISSGRKKPILQLATGSGKTFIGCSIVNSAVNKGKNVLWLAPRRELIYQAVESLFSFGVRAGVIMAGERLKSMLDVQVASFDTIHSRVVRNKVMEAPKADLIIVDEAHLSTAKSRLEVLTLYPDAIIVGLTATPCRGDGRGLGEFYDDLVEGVSIGWLMDNGYLAKAKYYAAEVPDLSMVKNNKDGDYQEKALGVAMDKPDLIGEIVYNWQRIAQGSSTVVFCVNRKHARHIHGQFLEAGISSEYLDGDTPKAERKEILRRVDEGVTTVLCNVFVATYGLDIPRLQTVVMARPTKNIGLYLQMIGRALRKHSDKDNAIIIDHAGVIKENGFSDDEQFWTLDSTKSAKEIKQKKKEEKKEPKEITCGECGTVFKARRTCPQCNHAMIPQSEEIPCHKADLEEVTRAKRKVNKNMNWDEKINFIGGLRSYAYIKGYSDGWVAHTYKDKTGVFPNYPRVKYASRQKISKDVQDFILHKQIKYRNRRKA